MSGFFDDPPPARPRPQTVPAGPTRSRALIGTVIVLVAAGGAAAVALNEDIRQRILGLVGIGSEESGPPQGSNGSQPTSVQPEGAPPTAATSQP